MELPEDQTKTVSQMRQWTIERLRDLRAAVGFSQADVASKMNVRFSRVGDFENNRSDYKASTVFRYARALGVRMDKVFVGAPAWRGRSPASSVVVISTEEAVQRLVALGYTEPDAKEAVEMLSR